MDSPLGGGVAGALDQAGRPDDGIDAGTEMQERRRLVEAQAERVTERVLLDDRLGRLDGPRGVMDLRAQQRSVGSAVETVPLEQPSREGVATRQWPATRRAVARAETRRRRARMIAATAEAFLLARLSFFNSDSFTSSTVSRILRIRSARLRA